MTLNYDPRKVREVQAEINLPPIEFWRPPEGETTIRMLPPVIVTGLPFYRYYVHRLEDRGNIRCRKTLDKDESCPICEWMAENSRDPNLRGLIVGLTPRLKHAINIVVRGEEPLKPKIWIFGISVANALVMYFQDEDYIVKDAQGNMHDLLDPMYGRDFKITRTGQGLTTKYQIVAKPNISPLHEDSLEAERILNERYNLHEILKVPEIEELSTTFFSWLQTKLNIE